jgi:hypothetical protein
VTLRSSRWRGWRDRALMLVLSLALIPLPAAASEAASSTPGVPAVKANAKQVSLKEGAALAAARTPLASTASARRQDATAKSSPAFFKTKGGAIALAVMVAGVGFALYSAKDDRITSPAKQ